MNRLVRSFIPGFGFLNLVAREKWWLDVLTANEHKRATEAKE